MARKHEHFGLSYLEELNIVRERENICKESRQEFLKFKQETVTAPSNLIQPVLKVEAADESYQSIPCSSHSSGSALFLLQVPDPLYELGTSKYSRKVRICSVPETMTQKESLPTQQKKSHKKECADKIPSHGSSRKAIQEDRSDGQEDETEKVSVAIASLVGTNKKITMLKKPECPPKPKYQKIVYARPLVNKPPPATLQKDHTEVEKLPPKKVFQHRIPVGSRTSIVTSEASDSFSMASTSSESYSKISEETIRPSLLSSVLELDETYSKKSSESSSLKSISEYVGETTGISRSDVLKVHERSSFPQGRLQSYTSVQKMPSALHPRSIDEIIASLRSTFPTPSDLKIKELLESILGQDFSINMEIPDLLPAETETKDEILTHIPQPPAVKTETDPSELKSPAKEVTATETEQIELDISRSTQSESIFSEVQQEVPKVEDDSTDTTEVEAQEVMMETPRRKTVHIVTEPSEEALGLHEIEGVTFSEPEQIHGSAASPVQNVLEKSITEECEEPLFSDILEVKGKAFPKTKPAEIQESLEEIKEEQPLSLLSTWTSDIKDVNYPLIHHLCMTYPRSVLPLNLQLASRVHHTLDKKGHCVLLPPSKIHYYESELEEFFPVTAAVTEQIEKERICKEGLPVSEVHQCNQKDGINVLPSPLPESMPEWQRVAEFYVEKPKLELLGKKVELHPASLKMFWTPAPQKFSAPLSVMKETLFSKYESNWINGVIYEDFSCDLREEEELESEDDFDNLLSNLTVSKRCYSCPQLEAEELKVEVIRGSISAPELSSYRDQGILNIDSNFKTTMEEMNVMKEHVSAKAKTMPSEAEGPPEKPQKLSLGTEKLSSGAEKPSPRADKDVVAEEDSDMIKKPKKDLFSPRVQQPRTSLDTNALAEVSRQAGMKYIVFPKQGQSKKSKKSDRFVTSEKLEIICETLNQPPRILLRATSLGELPTHNKFRIKVSQVVRSYRSPSLPSSLDFEKFAEKQGGIPENLNDYTWTRTIWNTWFDEVYPPSRPSSEDKNKIALDKKDLEKKKTVTEEKELTDLANLPPLEDKTDILPEFQSEIDRITLQIKENPSCAFSYCRRGAIYRKTGKLKAAMDDLEKAISLEPMLVNAYWHRHLLFLYQDKILLALEDLNFIIKCNKNHADAYLSRAAICRRQGNLSLAIINYTLAMKCRPTDDEIYYRRGEIHEEEGDILMAMDDYCKCFYYNPRRTDALMKHGIYYFEKCSWNIAINDFTAVIKEDPANAEARTFRGRAYIKQGKYTNAAEDFAAAIHLNPLNWIAYYHRGCLLRAIDPKQALQDLSISVLLNDNYENLSAFLHRGILYAELRQWMLAISDFRSAIFLDRTLTEAYINIGLIYMLHLERHFESIEQFTQAIRVNPLETRPYLCRAQAYHRIHDLKSAVRDINRAIHLQPNSPHLRLTRGQYLLEMKDYELASFCIHQVAQIGEGSFECSLVQEALVQSFCRNHNKAIECALKAARQQPDPPMFFMLGKLQMKAKKHKDALASFKQALRLLTGPSKTVPNTFEAAELYYYMGQCYMEQICLIEAFEAFTTAVKLYPRYADAYYERGLCRMQLQQTGAILDFNKVLAISPKHFQAYLSRAAYYGSKGRFSKAIVNCTEALKIYPNSVRAFLYRGTLKFYNRTYKHAIEDLNKAIAVDNVCILAHYNRAVSYHQMKDYRKALKDYGIVLLLEANKDLVLKVLINRALLYAELDQHANALEDLTEAALSKPKDSCLFKIIGICYHRLQKYEEAVNSFCKVLKLDPFCLDGYIGRGNAYMEYGHEEGTKRAQKDFLKAIHLNPVCLKARLCLGYSLQALGKFQKAWNQFSAAIQIDPNCHIAYDGRAIVCLQMGDTFAAFQDTNTALKITTNAELLTNRGVINQFMGYLTCAMKDYQQAITIDPGYALAYFNAANIYFFNRQFPQANDYYSKALVLDPKNESAFLNRAITNTLLKNFEEAKEDFEKAICLSPFSAAIYFNKANLYNTLEDYEQAEKDISQALSIQPYDALMHKLRADIRGKMGLIKEAITDYKNAISIQELISNE